jgi:orotidine-5'-phosphate decarboxylase
MSAAARDRLIVALDLPALAPVLALCDRLEGAITRVKVGLELFTAVGPRAVEVLAARNLRVFLDLKLHDIPETVRRAARAAAATGAELISVHTAGGPAMLEAAVEGARHGGGASVLGVTVLTSLDALQLAHIGTFTATVAELVVRRAELARSAGCAGVIASPLEVHAVRAAIGPGLQIITPGVRASAGQDDQKRTAGAAAARAAGADAVVVGRPIRDAPDPLAAALAILAELDTAAPAPAG